MSSSPPLTNMIYCRPSIYCRSEFVRFQKSPDTGMTEILSVRCVYYFSVEGPELRHRGWHGLAKHSLCRGRGSSTMVAATQRQPTIVPVGSYSIIISLGSHSTLVSLGSPITIASNGSHLTSVSLGSHLTSLSLGSCCRIFLSGEAYNILTVSDWVRCIKPCK